jgi:diguanylate cyclase (GGDEF)-like protein
VVSLLGDRDRTMVATMQSPSPSESAALDTAPQPEDALEVDPGRALGIALALRAEECCELTQSRLGSYPWVGRAPSVGYMQRVRGINWFATLLVARWIGYGVRVSDEEMACISERGDLAASEQLSIVNITRAYLIWRDTVLEVLREEAGRQQAPREVLSAAQRVVRTSCDAGLVQVARAFDERLNDLARDLTAEREALLHMALHDPLTALPNRVLFYDRIGQAVAAAKRSRKPFAVLEIDLDGFKNVNDSFGHSVGDDVLQETAARLTNAVRETDTVARVGGDEFLLLMVDVGFEAAQRKAAQLEKGLGQVLERGGRTVTVGASIGLAMYPDDGIDVNSLLSAADQAMYRSKAHRSSAG